jgi:phosphoribosyl-ATP pyrophosphohydrolase/phosphoribosyl-AMP cyclohydrolase
MAGAAEDDEALLGEAADLLFHLLVLLRSRGKSLSDLALTLSARHAGARPA